MSRRRLKFTKRQKSNYIEQSSKNWELRRFFGIWLFTAIILLMIAVWRAPAPHWEIAMFVIIGATLIALIEAIWPGRSGF